MSYSNTISLTFGDQAENHQRMQIIGTKATSSITCDELKNLYDNIKDECECELIDLNTLLPKDIKADSASLLIIRNYISNADELYNEINSLTPDKKALMYNRVVNKNARWNLCFDDFSQKADIENGKGTVVDFKDLKLLSAVRDDFKDLHVGKCDKLVCEANYYYDTKKCGISEHGDSERVITICVRLGASMPLSYRWYYKFKPVTEQLILTLNHGDIYIMSEKAVGNDWKKSSIYTLRHAAGADKFLKGKK